MDEKQCPDCQQLRQRVAELEARIEHLHRTGKRRLVIGGALPLLAAIAICTSLVIWTSKVQRQAETAVQQALDERDQAQKTEAKVKKQLEMALEMRQIMMEERNQALAAKKAAQRSEDNTKAVLAFLINNIFSAPGHPTSWSRAGLGKNVTLRQAVDAAESQVGEAFVDRPLVEASIRQILGGTYLLLEDAERAVQQYKRALDLLNAEFGPDDPATGECRNRLAIALREAGYPDEASRLFKLDYRSPSRAAMLSIEGSVLLGQNNPVEAELKLRQCLEIRRRMQPDDWTTFDVQAMLGAALLGQKKYAEAEPLLLSGYHGMKQRRTKIPSQARVRLLRALERLVQLYEAWGKKNEAAKWRKELEEAKQPGAGA